MAEAGEGGEVEFDWSDVEPIPQDDGPRPVVPIAYTDEFRELMDLFRAVLAKDERSARALKLTADVIAVNAANYTVWHFRRLVLDALGRDLHEELEYLDAAAEGNHKNYQIWHHRRWVVQKLGKDAVYKELEFTEGALKDDPKNYHAWSHRQWLLQELEDWKWELDYCSKLLEEDSANNSAWNQRFFVVTRCPSLGGLLQMRDSEVSYCVDFIKQVPTNESPWRYLKGLFLDDRAAFVNNSVVSEACITELVKDPNNVPAFGFLLDLLNAGFQPTSGQKEMLQKVLSAWETPSELTDAVCVRLQKVDAMRCQYWAWRRSLLPLPVAAPEIRN
ncbi:hypothetical protein KC19_10G014000 [Ceratodon purpureus]|uniref:Protein farnesyltransferase/geranylgeranyltransferase type-1 subunit alpha n=1 Tax=Ceratodon purpureus TaxID=3225 RepID=A0A8T0GI33_CERPU|nr:hypothetical protein KC19_10G014000 [Ceratodon purpureus]